MRRRDLLTMAAFAAVLSGCADVVTQSQVDKLRALIATAQTLHASLDATIPQLLVTVQFSPATTKALVDILADIDVATEGLSKVTDVLAGTPFVQAIVTGVNKILAFAAGVPELPEPYHSYLVAAAITTSALAALAGAPPSANSAVALTVSRQQVTVPSK